MANEFDPRAWNLFAGVALLAGCGGRVIGAEEAEGETRSSSTVSSSADETSGGCQTDSDCPSEYYCVGGVCEYVPHQDGHWDVYECYGHQDCETLQLCESMYCTTVDTPPACEVEFELIGLLGLPELPLALSFVDVDADDVPELVVATMSELRVYEADLGDPTVSPRLAPPEPILDMVGDDFDLDPGQDIVVLVAEQLRTYPASGMGGFGQPAVEPSPIEGARGLLGIDLDGIGTRDRLTYGLGAFAVGENGPITWFEGEAIEGVTGRDFTSARPGLAWVRADALGFTDLVGNLTGSVNFIGQPPHALTTLEKGELGEPVLVDVFSSQITSQVSNWSLLRSVDPETQEVSNSWGVSEVVDEMLSANVDGDEVRDVVMRVDGQLWIHFDVFGEDSCLGVFALADEVVEMAVGDHDGDGRDELVVRFGSGEVSIVDVL